LNRRPGGSERRVLAIDAGSSRTRLSVVTAAGKTVASVSEPAPSARPASVAAESPPEELWRQIAKLSQQLGGARSGVECIGVAGQLGVVLVDERGEALDSLLWPDRRAAAYVAPLADRLAGNASAIGRPVSAELPTCKLLWWREHRPQLVARTRWVLSLKDFLVLRLTGVAITDPTHASYTGWYDVRARRYAAPLIDAAQMSPDLLPEVRSGAEVAGVLSSDAAAALGLQPEVAVAVGGPDGAVGALGAGAVDAGAVVDVAGTTDVLLALVDAPELDLRAGALLNAFLLRQRWTVGGPTGYTGGAVDWLCGLLGYPSTAAAVSALGSEIFALPFGADGATFTPSLSGSRMPAWRSNEAGVLAGLRQHHSPAHVVRAALEGAAFAVREGIAAVSAAGVPIREVTLVGGVAQHDDVAQLRSDLWQLPVRRVRGNEATTLGVAALAGIAADVFESLDEAKTALVVEAGVVTPRALAPEVEAAWQRWRDVSALGRQLSDEGVF
jgi:xylulokinase